MQLIILLPLICITLVSTSSAFAQNTADNLSNPLDAQAEKYRVLGALDIATNNFQGALENYNKSIALAPDYAAGYVKRAGAKLLLKDDIGALSDYSEAISLDDSYSEAYVGRANIYSLIGREKDALVDYDQAIVLNPQLEDAHLGRGLTLLKLGDKSKACSSLQISHDLTKGQNSLEITETDIVSIDAEHNKTKKQSKIAAIIDTFCH